MITAIRYHDFCAGHRVYGHESKCAHLHGHNYRVHFEVAPDKGLDTIGRVLDFSVIKSILCEWLETNWDHKFLLWKEDPMGTTLKFADPDGVVIVPFNPTAENMAKYLVDNVSPALMKAHDIPCTLIRCTIEETRKCSVSYAV
jgi:6-pyruvoyltetrahydropterin/6-carboxytetrahydropterin synthase